MEKLGEVLKQVNLSGETTFEPFRVNKAKRPQPLKCLACNNDEVDWFWLESEYPKVLPCQWKPQLCRCMILHFLKGRRKFMSNNLNLLAKKPYDNQIAAEIRETKEKIIFDNKVIKAVEGLKSNVEYYQKRFDLADDLCSFEEYGDLVWWWLFDCESKGETEFYLKILELEQSVAPEEIEDGEQG